ncbi:MAG: hypothetical protein KDJ29_21085, partial [Hyphomicrobiales bacterium]|nr:hypothetical protein [Hyphomicrobiales bacterium]
MGASLFDRIIGHAVFSTGALLGLIAAVVGYFAYETSGWYILACAFAVAVIDAAEKRVQSDREWTAVKTPGRLHRTKPAPVATKPPRRGFFRRLFLVFGHPVIAWPALLAVLAYVYGRIALEMDSRDYAALDLSVIAGLAIVAFARRARRRDAKALAVAVAETASTPKTEMLVATAVPALAVAPSVREAMQRLEPPLLQLVCEGVSQTAARR